MTTARPRGTTTSPLVRLVGPGVVTGLLISRLDHGFAALLLAMALTQAFASLASP